MFISLHAENLFLAVWRLSPCFVYPCLSRSIIVIQAIHARLQCGLFVWVGTRSCFEALETETWGKVGEGQLIRKILLLIRAITHCHNYQCHQLVCNEFLLHPGTAERPPYFTRSQLHYLIGYMQIGPKLKATCKGTPRGTVLYTHTHTLTSHSTIFFRFNLQPSPRKLTICHMIGCFFTIWV